MVRFNGEKFCSDLTNLRGKETQTELSKKLGINRTTLSFLENGKQIPSIEILSNVCALFKTRIEDYFFETTSDSLVYLMGSLEESDKAQIKEMAERIRIKEKYERLAKRESYVID